LLEGYTEKDMQVL